MVKIYFSQYQCFDMTHSFLFVLIPLVSGWSEEGHAIITKVATRLISDQASRYLENHLGEDLVKASVWADSDEASTRYPESSEYHFSHTPYRDCQPFDIDRDCGFPGTEGLCIVTGLADAIAHATNPSVSREERADALKFVLHFMGDIHQPLHTGFREDFGGNSISISNMPNKTLHGLWDFDLVRRRIGGGGIDAFTELIESSVRSKSGAFIKRVQEQADVLAIIGTGATAEIAKYTAMLATDTTMTSTCKLAYMRNATSFIEDGDVISDEYLDHRGVSVQVQLSKAAVRLSLLLDAMAEVFIARRAAQKEVSREQRIKKLFEERKMAAEILARKVSYPLEGNRFAVLAMEFDPVKLQWIMKTEDEEEVAATGKESVSLPRTVVRRTRRENIDDKVLDEIIAARNRTTFQGVDLSQIVLLVRHGLNIVTFVHCVNTPRGYTPASVVVFKVKFSGNAPGHETVSFHFDADVFPRDMSVELAVRSLLKLRGIDVDGTTDLNTLWTDRGYGDAVASVERESRLLPAASDMQRMGRGVTGYGSFGENANEFRVRKSKELALRTNAYLKQQSEKRFEQLDREFMAFQVKQGRRKRPVSIEDFWIANIERVKDEIVVFTQGRLMMVTLASTLSDPANAMRIRFNNFDVLSADPGEKEGGKISFLVDPNILDSYMSLTLYGAICKTIKKDPKRTGRVILVNRPALYDELRDLESVLFGTDEDRLDKLKVVQFIRMYNTNSKNTWNQPVFRVIEWATNVAPASIFDPPEDFELPSSSE